MDYKGPAANVGVPAHASRDKPFNVRSKVRACTRKASFADSVSRRNDSIAHAIDASRRPDQPETQTVGSYGPTQSIRVWRRS